MILLRAISDSSHGTIHDLYFAASDIIEFVSRLSPVLSKGRNIMTGKIGLFDIKLFTKIYESNVVDNIFVITETRGNYFKGDIITGCEVQDNVVVGHVSRNNVNIPISVPVKCVLSTKERSKNIVAGDSSKGFKTPKSIGHLVNLDNTSTQKLLNEARSDFHTKIDRNFVNKISLSGMQPGIKDGSSDCQKKVDNDSIPNVSLRNPRSLISSKCSDPDENVYEEESLFVEESRSRRRENNMSTYLIEEFRRREARLENDIKVIMDDIVSVKKKMSQSESDPEYTQMMSNNLAFLKEEYKEKQKQVTHIKEQKEKAVRGTFESTEESTYCTVDDFDDVEKTQSTRFRIFEEIIETEKKFMTDLQVTLKAFDLSKMKNKIAEQDYHILFDDLKAVISVSENFHAKLSVSFRDNGSNSCIGSIFLMFLNLFEAVYKEYCINYDRKLEIINKKPKSFEMENFLNEGLKVLSDNGTMISSLDSMLVKPLQRFLKYPLFIKTIIQNTDEEHVDMPSLKSVSSKIENIALKINEKKRFEEIRTEIFDRSEQWHQRTLHAIRKGPQRLLIATRYGSQQNDDIEYFEAVQRFKNLKKNLLLFTQTITILRNSLKETMIIQLSIGDTLVRIIGQKPEKELLQYVNICQSSESNYLKKSILLLEDLVINPVTKLLDLFSGPKILIKKRKSAFLDYVGMKEKIENREASRTQIDKNEELKNKYLAINNTLKEELPILNSRSTDIFDACIANYRVLTTSIIQKTIADLSSLIGDNTNSIHQELRSCSEMQIDILSSLHRNLLVYKFKTNIFFIGLTGQSADGVDQPQSIGRADYYHQTDDDIADLKGKFSNTDLALVKKDFIPNKPHHIRISTGNIVGIIKRCDPQNRNNFWLVEVGPKRIGFVPKTSLNSVTVVESRRTSATLPRSFESTKSMRESTFDIDLTLFAPNSASAKKESNLCDSMFHEVRNALFDYKSTLQSDISMQKNDKLILIEGHDKTGNPSWSLVTNLRTGDQGYVPSNYISNDNQ